LSLQFTDYRNDTEIFICINDTPLLNVTFLYVSKYTDENVLNIKSEIESVLKNVDINVICSNIKRKI